jgi:hypothetical protein
MDEEHRLVRKLFDRPRKVAACRVIADPALLIRIARGDVIVPDLANDYPRVIGIRGEAASIYARSLGRVSPGTDYPRDRFLFEASLLNQKVDVFQTLYRQDRRDPSQVAASDGFHGNPNFMSYTLWEHVQGSTESGSFVSTTLQERNDYVAEMVARPLRDLYFMGTKRSKYGRIFEYRISQAEGMRTPLDMDLEAGSKIVNIGGWTRF